MIITFYGRQEATGNQELVIHLLIHVCVCVSERERERESNVVKWLFGVDVRNHSVIQAEMR